LKHLKNHPWHGCLIKWGKETDVTKMESSKNELEGGEENIKIDIIIILGL
jgi:hypothetical protein